MRLLTAPICVLLLASVLTAVTEHWLDTGAVLVIILLNLLANWLQQNVAQSSPNLADGFPDRASVRRGGNILQVDTRSLVPGDIIMLGAGDKVPADLRLIEAQNLRVDESMLTGETTAVAKQTAATEGERPVEARSNMLFCGSTLVSGCASGIAVATGAKTQLGRIEAALCSVRPRRTMQLRSFDRLGNGFWLLMVTLIAFLFFLCAAAAQRADAGADADAGRPGGCRRAGRAADDYRAGAGAKRLAAEEKEHCSPPSFYGGKAERAQRRLLR